MVRIGSLDRSVTRLTSHWEPAKSPFGLELLRICHSRRRGQDHGVQNEAVFIPLHLSHHLRLLIRWAVIVDNAQATQKSHVDRHVVLGHGIHGGRQERGLQGEPSGHLGFQIHIGSRESCSLD